MEVSSVGKNGGQGDDTKGIKPKLFVASSLTPDRVKELAEMTQEQANLVRGIQEAGIRPLKSVIPSGQHIDKTMTYDVQPGPNADQGSTARCWIFSSNQLFEIAMHRQMGIDMQLSANFVAFYDKLGKANYIFSKMVEYKDIDPTDKRITGLLDELMVEGGQWEFYANIVKRYGIAPMDSMPETQYSMNSQYQMNLLKRKVGQICGLIHCKANAGASDKDLQKIIDEGLKAVTGILVGLTGKPPETIWVNNEKITPLEFYERVCKKCEIDVDAIVNITDLPYRKKGTNFVVKDRSNMIGGRPLAAINVDMTEIFAATQRSLAKERPAVMSIDLVQMVVPNIGSINADQTQSLLRSEIPEQLSKGDRLRFRQSQIAHGVTAIGIKDKEAGDLLTTNPDYLSVFCTAANSWKKAPKIVFTKQWLERNQFAVAVDKKFVDKKWLGLKSVEVEPGGAYSRL